MTETAAAPPFFGFSERIEKSEFMQFLIRELHIDNAEKVRNTLRQFLNNLDRGTRMLAAPREEGPCTEIQKAYSPFFGNFDRVCFLSITAMLTPPPYLNRSVYFDKLHAALNEQMHRASVYTLIHYRFASLIHGKPLNVQYTEATNQIRFSRGLIANLINEQLGKSLESFSWLENRRSRDEGIARFLENTFRVPLYETITELLALYLTFSIAEDEERAAMFEQAVRFLYYWIPLYYIGKNEQQEENESKLVVLTA